MFYVVVLLVEDVVKIDSSINIWIDYCEFFFVFVVDKDYYDGFVDVFYGLDFIMVF